MLAVEVVELAVAQHGVVYLLVGVFRHLLSDVRQCHVCQNQFSHLVAVKLDDCVRPVFIRRLAVCSTFSLLFFGAVRLVLPFAGISPPLNEAVCSVPVTAYHVSNLARAHLPLHHLLKLVFPLSVLLSLVRVAAAYGATEKHSKLHAQSQTLARALPYHLPLNLGGQAEGKGKHLALHIVSKHEAVLHRVDDCAHLHAVVQDVHDHVQVTPQAANLRADDDVVFLYLAEQRAKFALVGVFSSAHALVRDVFLYLPAVVTGELNDALLLRVDVLLVAAHSQISVNHQLINFMLYRCLNSFIAHFG